MASQVNSVELWSGDLALVVVDVKRGQRACKEMAPASACPETRCLCQAGSTANTVGHTHLEACALVSKCMRACFFLTTQPCAIASLLARFISCT